MNLSENNQVKLTARKKPFLSRLMDVYREVQMSVHYSLIAHNLGLCASTAYDMLRVRREKAWSFPSNLCRENLPGRDGQYRITANL